MKCEKILQYLRHDEKNYICMCVCTCTYAYNFHIKKITEGEEKGKV